VAEQLAASRPGAVKGVVSLSGPFNFPQIRADFRNKTITNESFKQSVHLALHWYGPFPQALAEAWSPALHAPHSNCPPWLLFNSETELIPLAQAREMQSNLTAAGCSAKLVVVPGSAHSFEYWSQVSQQINAFVSEH
jgi:pimeloyl-ACP methyl ester carboxylesterase